jgi:hypothetical protein
MLNRAITIAIDTNHGDCAQKFIEFIDEYSSEGSQESHQEQLQEYRERAADKGCLDLIKLQVDSICFHRDVYALFNIAFATGHAYIIQYLSERHADFISQADFASVTPLPRMQHTTGNEAFFSICTTAASSSHHGILSRRSRATTIFDTKQSSFSLIMAPQLIYTW